MEIRLRFTISEYGHDPAHGERFLAAFMETHPDTGPSVSQDTADGTLTVTFALDADDAKEAIQDALQVFTDGANATALPPTGVVIDVEASVVAAEEFTAESEAIPVPA